MIIELKFNIDALHLLSELLNRVYNADPNAHGTDKLLVSIAYELADKFEKKFRTQQKKPSLFDTKKKYKVSLKYFEAWALHKIITEIGFALAETPFQQAVLTKISTHLHPKL